MGASYTHFSFAISLPWRRSAGYSFHFVMPRRGVKATRRPLCSFTPRSPSPGSEMLSPTAGFGCRAGGRGMPCASPPSCVMPREERDAGRRVVGALAKSCPTRLPPPARAGGPAGSNCYLKFPESGSSGT